MLPLKAVSRLWGKVNGLELPQSLRSPFLGLYIWAFNVNLEEAAVKDLRYYRNLGEFFRRQLAKGVRPVDQENCVTCPSDGKVLHFGKVERGMVEQVKGLSYSLKHFLGPVPQLKISQEDSYKIYKTTTTTTTTSSHKTPTNSLVQHANMSAIEFENSVRQGKDTELYHCVIYLAPGDYHGFHAPTEWTVAHRRHFPGDLLSVNPGIAQWIAGLFNLNERVVYTGTWQHGFFSMVAVGATNVGSMHIYMDRTLETNVTKHRDKIFLDNDFTEKENDAFPEFKGVPFNRGEPFGEFNLGSTIVLVFEAPADFEFKVTPGQTVKYGQPLGQVNSAEAA